MVSNIKETASCTKEMRFYTRYAAYDLARVECQKSKFVQNPTNLCKPFKKMNKTQYVTLTNIRDCLKKK